MSLPGLAVLYAGLVPKKWVVNTMFMAFTGFSTVLVVWVLWGYKMGFGSPIGGGTRQHVHLPLHRQLLRQLLQQLRRPSRSRSMRGNAQIGQAATADRRPRSRSRCRRRRCAYFQFVFAAITPLLFLGSVLGRIKVKVWMIFVPLWSYVRLHGQRHAALGRRLLGPRGRARLLGRLRHPPGRRHQRVRGGLGDRAPAGPGPGPIRAAQPAPGRGRRRHPVAGLERLQRW